MTYLCHNQEGALHVDLRATRRRLDPRQCYSARRQKRSRLTIVRPSRSSPKKRAAHRRRPLVLLVFSALVITSSSKDIFLLLILLSNNTKVNEWERGRGDERIDVIPGTVASSIPVLCAWPHPWMRSTRCARTQIYCRYFYISYSWASRVRACRASSDVTNKVRPRIADSFPTLIKKGISRANGLCFPCSSTRLHGLTGPLGRELRRCAQSESKNLSCLPNRVHSISHQSI